MFSANLRIYTISPTYNFSASDRSGTPQLCWHVCGARSIADSAVLTLRFRRPPNLKFRAGFGRLEQNLYLCGCLSKTALKGHKINKNMGRPPILPKKKKNRWDI